MEKNKNESGLTVLYSEDNEEIKMNNEGRFLGTLIVGPSGSGKTQGVLRPMINRDIKSKTGGITIFDKFGDLSEPAYVYARSNRRNTIYLNPSITNIRFNPMKGEENDVIDSIVTAFKFENKDMPQFFADMCEILLTNSIKVLKRLYGDNVTFNELVDFINNENGIIKDYSIKLSRLESIDSVKSENMQIFSWFMKLYLNEDVKISEHCHAVKVFFNNILSNTYLRKMFDTKEKDIEELDFKRHITNKDVAIVDLSFLVFTKYHTFIETLLLKNYQSSVFSNIDKNVPNYIYIDGIPNSPLIISELILRGRIYNIGLNVTLQTITGLRALGVYSLALSNMRNLLLMPGIYIDDIDFYSSIFGMKYSTADILYRSFGEVIYSLFNNNVKGCLDIGIGHMKLMSEEDDEFVKKRMAVYKKQFFK